MIAKRRSTSPALTEEHTEDSFSKEPLVSNYFVDEAGDGTIFNKKGQVIVGTEGCSRFFILGLLEVQFPDTLSNQLNDLRTQIVNDPYLQRIESVKPERMKTALAFHAKDDTPEVRERAFRLLHATDGLRFFAVVKDMQAVLGYVNQRNSTDPNYRYRPNELYDLSVRLLFRDRLHMNDVYNITFARRGTADRTRALKASLELARGKFKEKYGIQGTGVINIRAEPSRNSPCLQATDYFLWATQRLYEMREERYIAYLGDKVKLVYDIDDTRSKQYGEFYNKKKPLSLANLGERF